MSERNQASFSQLFLNKVCSFGLMKMDTGRHEYHENSRSVVFVSKGRTVSASLVSNDKISLGGI